MFWNVVLLVMMAGLAIGSFHLNGRELFEPCTLFYAFFALAVSFSLLRVGIWGDTALQVDGFAVIALGSLCFGFGAQGLRRLLRRHNPAVVPRHRKEQRSAALVLGGREYQVKCGLLILLSLLALMVYVIELRRLGSELGIDASSFTGLINGVRSEVSVIHTTDGMLLDSGFSLVERQLEKIVVVAGYVAVYLLVRASCLWRDGSRRISVFVAPLIMLVVSCVFTLLRGGRGSIIFLGVFGVVLLFLSALDRGESPARVSRRFLVLIIPAALVAAVAFYFMGALVGRRAGTDIVEYLTFYFGCGIPGLQQALESATAAAADGTHTFYGVFSVLYKFGLISDLSPYTIMWVTVGQHACNVFTCFYRYLLDFGWAGVIVFGMLSGGIYALAYWRARATDRAWERVVCCYLLITVIDLAREDFLFSRALSLNVAITLTLLALATLFLTVPFDRYLPGRLARLLSGATASEMPR